MENKHFLGIYYLYTLKNLIILKFSFRNVYFLYIFHFKHNNLRQLGEGKMYLFVDCYLLIFIYWVHLKVKQKFFC